MARVEPASGRGVALAAVLIPAFLLFPASAPAGNEELIECSVVTDFKHMSISEETGKHLYSFATICKESNGDTFPADINWSYDPATHVLKEQVIPGTGNALLNLTYVCKLTDPEGLRFENCQRSGSPSVMGPIKLAPSGMGPSPLIRGYIGLIRSYVQKKVPVHPAPVVITPAPGEAYPIMENLQVSIEHAKSIWYRLARVYETTMLNVPQAVEKVFLVAVDRFEPKAGGGTWRRYGERWLHDGVIMNDPFRLDAGMYRLQAAHAHWGSEYRSPWSAPVVFWVGEKVNYSLPVPRLDKPVHGFSEAGGAIPFLAADPVTPQQMAGVDFDLNLMDQGIWKDALESNYLQGIAGLENIRYLTTGVYRTRVRFAGGLNPWSEWHAFVAGTPPGGSGAAADYLPDFSLKQAESLTGVALKGDEQGKYWELTWRQYYYGYRSFMDKQPSMKVLVACIPRGGQSCGEPNPDFLYKSSSLWAHPEPLDETLPQLWFAEYRYAFRPEQLLGTWLLLVSVDPHDFIGESNEDNNSVIWSLDTINGFLEDGLPLLEGAVLQEKNLPEGLDGRLLKTLRTTKGGVLPVSSARVKFDVTGAIKSVPAAKAGQTAKSGAAVTAPGGPGKTTPRKAPPLVASVSSQAAAVKLVFNDVNSATTLKHAAWKTFDLALPIKNEGKVASERMAYSVACRVQGGGATCPFVNLPGTLDPVAPGKSGEIKLKGLKFPPGKFELAVKLDSGLQHSLKLVVAAAAVKPAAVKSAPGIKPKAGASNDAPQATPRLRLP